MSKVPQCSSRREAAVTHLCRIVVVVWSLAGALSGSEADAAMPKDAEQRVIIRFRADQADQACTVAPAEPTLHAVFKLVGVTHAERATARGRSRQALHDGDPIDGKGHGTHVAGPIAASQNGLDVVGVAPDAKLMAVRILGKQSQTDTVIIAQGIQYAVDMGADILNMSIGSTEVGNDPLLNRGLGLCRVAWRCVDRGGGK